MAACCVKIGCMAKIPVISCVCKTQLIRQMVGGNRWDFFRLIRRSAVEAFDGYCSNSRSLQVAPTGFTGNDQSPAPEMKVDLPDEYIELLSQANGVDANSLSLYSCEEVPDAMPPMKSRSTHLAT